MDSFHLLPAASGPLAADARLPGILNSACVSVGAWFVSPTEPSARRPRGVVPYCSFLL